MILFPDGRPTKLETFEEYLAAGGYECVRRNLPPAAILAEITASGLRGRGGAGFPVGRKWSVTAESPHSTRYLVCNAGEDEPGSFKDYVLLMHRPHLVLEGMLLAACAIGANKAYLYLNETYDDCCRRMTQAIAEASAAGHLGSVEVMIHAAPTAYVAGEDSASLEVLEGKPPLPRQKPPYPAAAGLFGKPTVVNNVETLANVSPIVRHGAAWFRGFGTTESPGTMIFCLGEEVATPGAYEVAFGTPLRNVYESAGGRLKNGNLKAILPGPSSAFLTDSDLDITLEPESFRKSGSTLGCGVIRFYSEDECMVEETLRLARFFARESCGQCPACRMETGMLVALLDKIQQGTGEAALYDQFPRVIDFNRGKGFCGLINMPGQPILSALRLFRAEFDQHLQHGRCDNH